MQSGAEQPQPPAGGNGRRWTGSAWLAVVVLFLWIGVTILTGQQIHGTQALVDLVSTAIARQLVFALLFLVLVIWLIDWPDLGMRFPRGPVLSIIWFPSLWIGFLLVMAFSLGLPSPGRAAVLAANCLLVGLSEEIMFRGVLLSGLRRRLSLWWAVAAVTLSFGIVHVLNAFVTGNLVIAAVQAGAATMSGLLLMALRLRTGSLWVPVLFHAAWDFATFCVAAGADLSMQDGPDGSARFLSLAFVAPLGLYALFLLRRRALLHPAVAAVRPGSGDDRG